MKRSVTKLTDKQIYRSLHNWFAESTAQEREDGKLWYKEAQMFTKYVAEEYGIDSYRHTGS